ncbi:cellulose synthase [Pandoraea terrae]|uniref:cellulose synthase (UDP-forming) n=1 Tax=Pandoraea terrae TaxID=1537710 RepID=A0A5E4SZP7_9BURK|nr:glycosyltransferase family 2 protein [Pandoraea terrae]VVD81346.1 cellulose synthase [Pandoraea terrae]
MYTLYFDDQTLIAINLATLSIVLLLGMLGDRKRALDRMLFGGVTAAILVIYLGWRVNWTLPAFEFGAASLWAYVFFAFETVAITYTLLSIVVLTRSTDYTATADRAEARLRRRDDLPAVDIFIATYNEGLDILEKTIVSALAIDYPNFHVWVLDDTRRVWLKEFCEQVGAGYVTRENNTHAKAGNLNNGLQHTARLSNAPFIMVLDADFAPRRNILMRIMGFFDDPKVGVVQTPQFYYNADPIQYNLRSTECWVDDQRAFFDVVQPAKDAWGTAFCIGTSFVVRRDAVNEIGGFPTGTVTEDIHLSYRLMPRGYITRWLNERLSVGLSAEGLPEFISQRSRWGLGTIQVALTADGPLRGRGYSFTQRLHYIHGLLLWLSRPFTVMLLVAPLLYWYFDIPTLYSEPLHFVAYGLPALVAFWGYSIWVTGARVMPVFSEVTQIASALTVSATLVSAIFKPFGRPFKVTNKGLDRSRLVVHGKLAMFYMSLIVLSALGLIRTFASDMSAPGLAFNTVWTALSLVLYLASLLICVELPRPRREERFPFREEAKVRIGGREVGGMTHDLSCNGVAVLSRHAHVVDAHHDGEVWIASLGWMPCRIARRDGELIGLELQLDMAMRHRIIRALFCAPPANVASRARPRMALSRLLTRAFSG